MTYDHAISVLRKHQGHGEALVCLLSQDAAMGRSQPDENLASPACQYLAERLKYLERLGYPAYACTEVLNAMNWFEQFAGIETNEA